MRNGNRAELESTSRSSKPRVIWRQRYLVLNYDHFLSSANSFPRSHHLNFFQILLLIIKLMSNFIDFKILISFDHFCLTLRQEYQEQQEGKA